MIVVAGGDGTCSRVADAILRFGADSALAVLPSGTGNDFAKILGVERYTPDQLARLVVDGATTPIDVGRADDRYFINSCGFGFDASVLEATGRVKFLKGDALYIYAALAQLFTYRGLAITLDQPSAPYGGELLMATISNGRYLGGVFRIAPEASVTDGQLDVCLVGNASVLERIRLFSAAIRGTHGELRMVRAFPTAGLTLTFDAAPSIELDGELRRARSTDVRISCVPRALKVIAAPGAIR